MKPTHLDTPLSESQPGLDWPWQKRRDWFRARLQARPPSGIAADELEAHCSGMPPHYWEQVDEADLVWGVEAIHEFLKLAIAPGSASATKPFMAAREGKAAGLTRVLLCTWDRQGLLAKAAAAFSELRLSILAAEAFTRADDLVLDIFTVVDLDSGAAATPARLKEAHFLLEGALSEPPRFASVWMCSRHKYLAPTAGQPAPQITFDNESSEASTLVHIEAGDRLGLLYDILQTLAEAGLNVTEAQIRTEARLAKDVVYVRDTSGKKVTGAARLEELRSKLQAALSLKPAQ